MGGFASLSVESLNLVNTLFYMYMNVDNIHVCVHVKCGKYHIKTVLRAHLVEDTNN